MDGDGKPPQDSALTDVSTNGMNPRSWMSLQTSAFIVAPSNINLRQWGGPQAPAPTAPPVTRGNPRLPAPDPTTVRNSAFFRPWECSPAPTATTVPVACVNFCPQTLVSTDVLVENTDFRQRVLVPTAVAAQNARYLVQDPGSIAVSVASASFCSQAVTSFTIPVVNSSSRGQAPALTAVPAASRDPCPQAPAPTVIATDGENFRLPISAPRAAPVKSLNLSRLTHFAASRKTTIPHSPHHSSPSPASEQHQEVGIVNEAQSKKVASSTPLIQANDQESDVMVRIDRIRVYVNSLEPQVKSCVAKSRNELEYVFLNGELKDVLSTLDNVNVRGKDNARKKRKRLIEKVNKIIDELNTKVPPVTQEPRPSDQEEHHDPGSEQDEEQQQSELARQQVEKIRERLQEKFGSLDEESTEMYNDVEADDTSDDESVNMESEDSSPESKKKKKKGGKKEWHEKFKYKFDKISGCGTRHFACISAGGKSKGCEARLKIDKDGNRIATGWHNHLPPVAGKEKEEFYAELRKAVQSQRTDIISIYRQVAEKYEDVAIHYPIHKVERNMYRWRSEVRTRGKGKVRVIDDYVKFFETPDGQKLLEYDPVRKRRLSYKLITETVDTKEGRKIFKHLALYDEETLKEHEKCTVLQDDATFLSRPKVHGVTQLFTIMARNYDKCFPCVWFLMSSRTAHAYEACLTALKHEIWKKMNPKEVIADFEEAMEKAWGNVYPNAELTGCYFHFTQALLRNAIKKGCATHRNLQDHPEKHLIIRMLMALALLPPGDIKKTYEEIKELARAEHGEYFNALFEYLDSYWFERRGVQRFCVFGKLDRTNNEQESMHKVLNFLFKHRQPHPWQFIDVFIEILKINNFNLRVEKTTMGTSKRPRKLDVIFKEKDLLRCWNLLKYKRASFTPLMMVTKVAYSLEPKYIQLGQIHSITHGDEEGVDAEAGVDCEGVPDERIVALEAETGFGFDADNQSQDGEIRQSSKSERDNGDEGSVLGNVNNLRINLEDIEGLFDSDSEDSSEKDGQEQAGIATDTWRIPFDELYTAENEPNQISNRVRCYERNLLIQPTPASSSHIEVREECQEPVVPFSEIDVDEENQDQNQKKRASTKEKRKVTKLVDESGDVGDVPRKRHRKSVMDGKFRDYSC